MWQKKDRRERNVTGSDAQPHVPEVTFLHVPEVTCSHVPEVTFSHVVCPPHGLDGEDGGDDVVGVVLAAGHVHEPVPGAADEDEPPGTQEAQQARPHKLRLASHILPVFRFRSYLSHKTIILENLRGKIHGILLLFFETQR